MEAEFLKYQKLFTEFNKLDKMEDTFVTFMELSGYPHFENVCSNILSFYFDTQQKHGLKDLAIKSLLQCIPESDYGFGEIYTKEVHREYGIKDLKRIDLVIDCNDFCVSIENKIFHWLHNDLAIYESEINKKFPNQKNYHIVLSLKKENVIGRFVSITYEQFFNRLKSNLGHYSIEGNNTYIIYLLDFIKTIENHYKMTDVNKEMFQFLISNQEIINEIETEKNKLKNLLIGTVNKISQRIEFENPNFHKKWIYQRNVIVYDFKFEDYIIGVDLWIDYNFYAMDIFVRSNEKYYQFLNQLEICKNNSLKENTRGYDIIKRKINFFDINEDELVNEVENILKQVKL